MRKWTEHELQNMLAMKFNNRGSLCVPNCEAFGWEADLVRVTPRLFSAEYEIKVSLADFRHDAAKQAKHVRLEDCTSRTGERGLAPNHFWYVAPQGVVPADELPPHAGLIEIVGCDIVPVVKAPKLHGHKLPVDKLLWLTRGAARRYWDSRRAEVAHVAAM